MPRKIKKRNAWLITWDSSRDDYLKDIKRPRVVAILNSRTPLKIIKLFLQTLFASESRLTFSQKLAYSFPPRDSKPYWEEMQSICFGNNPWLRARRVSDLYVESSENSDEQQILYWTELPYTQEDPKTGEFEHFPQSPQSEMVDFYTLWDI